MMKGLLALHLHAHLPYIRHPEHESFLEERWFFDAIVDTYVPLLSYFERLHVEGVPFRLSMTFSPTLLAMLGDHLLHERFQAHLDLQLDLCIKEQQRIVTMPEFMPVVDMYQRRLQEVQRQFNRFGGNIARGFQMLADQGHLEIVTCGATHGFLPHMQLVPGAVARQLRYAVETHAAAFGMKPEGIWLPECAYYPGLEEELLKQGILYFFTDSHALVLGAPRSIRSVFSHVYLPNGVAAFARDVESSKQVWSAKEGYPGDGVYRDFYRDVGFDLPLDYVKHHIHDGRTRILTGFKYYAITGETEHKNVYNPQAASERAREHAYHFVWCREQQSRWLLERMDREPLIVAPYDAELFGHWWFEGPEFLYWMFRAVAENGQLEAIAARDYMLKYPRAQVAVPNASSWGDGGYYRVWLNASNEWIYPHLNAAARLVEDALERVPQPAEWGARGRRQLERELLLAQASDWAFIMTTGTSPGYATERTVRHLFDLHRIREGLLSGEEPPELGNAEWRDNAF